MVFVRDITAEVERRERIALLNLVADKTTRAVVVTDRNLRVVYTNAAFSGNVWILGRGGAGTASRRAARRTVDRPQDPAPAASPDLTARRREEVLAYDRNGDEIWVSATVKAFRNDRGRIKYVFALLSDISENKQLRSLQQLIMARWPTSFRSPGLPTSCAGASKSSHPMSSLRCCTSTPTA